MKLFDGIGGPQTACAFLEAPPSRGGQGRQDQPARLPGLVLQWRPLGCALERCHQAAIAIAFQSRVERSGREHAPRLDAGKERLKRAGITAIPFPCRGGLLQPGQQDIHVAHVAERSGKPLQFLMELLAPVPIDQAFERGSSLRNRRVEAAQVMDPLAVPPPGLGIAGRDPRNRSLESR